MKKSRKSKSLPDKQSNFLLYTGNDGKVNVEVFLKDETVWLTQKAMAELFGVKTPAISKHMSNIFESGELQKEATVSILETVQKEGNRQVKRKMEFYNLDVIISVGYRVNSYQATQFRIWATKTLKEYIIKGSMLDANGSSRATAFLGKIILTNCWSASGKSVPVNGDFTRKSRIYTPSPLIMIKTLPLQKSFSPQSKANCIGP